LACGDFFTAARCGVRFTRNRPDPASDTFARRNPAGLAAAPSIAAVLIFPKIYKGGLIIDGLSGDGVLRVGSKAAGYYNISAASRRHHIATRRGRIQSCLNRHSRWMLYY
jgi:anti-sigma factor RsiW